MYSVTKWSHGQEHSRHTVNVLGGQVKSPWNHRKFLSTNLHKLTRRCLCALAEHMLGDTQNKNGGSKDIFSWCKKKNSLKAYFQTNQTWDPGVCISGSYRITETRGLVAPSQTPAGRRCLDPTPSDGWRVDLDGQIQTSVPGNRPSCSLDAVCFLPC